MNTIPDDVRARALDWCDNELGDVRVVSDHTQDHGGHVSATCRLRYSDGHCYLKVHQSGSHWHSEAHAYRRWAGVFTDRAPRLVKASEQHLALVITELPGTPSDGANLSGDQEVRLWRDAGAALMRMHAIGSSVRFGRCLRDGWLAEDLPRDPGEYVALRLRDELNRAKDARCLTGDETDVLHTALRHTSAFEGEHAVPCHRDYTTANWLVDDRGGLSGVIDFEFSRWDVRATDFCRHPEWQWMAKPYLMDAFLEGYGWPLNAARRRQLFVARAHYALEAIVWGREHSFFGFEREGRDCLAYLARQEGLL